MFDRKWSLKLLLAFSLTVFLYVNAGASESVLTEKQTAEIKEILTHRVDSLKLSPAIVVGVINEQGSKVIAYGTKSEQGSGKVDGETIFEIGSISKVFTTLLLADLVLSDELSLNDPIYKHLPEEVDLSGSELQEIELEHLASHTSGLPRLPTNFSPKDPKNPYADYDTAELYEYLRSAELQTTVGETAAYSNLGMGLLGHILTLVTGTNYETMLKETICGPLQMNSTVIELNSDLKKRLADGHNRHGEKVDNWDLTALASAGAIRSTANDMLKFLAVNLGYVQSELSDALDMCYEPREGTDSGIGLGWVHSEKSGSKIIWHNGGTGGYRSFIGFCPEKGLGVVVLSNSDRSNDDLGFHLLEPESKLESPEARPVEIELPREVLEQYVGVYDLTENFKLTVDIDDGRLTVQGTGQPAIPVYAQSETKFFSRAVDAQVSFAKDESGNVTHLVLHQGGVDSRAIREGAEYTPEGSKGEIKLDPSQLAKFEGEYQLQPGVKFYVYVQDGRLMVQLTGQPAVQVFPESKTEFFYKVVDAQITFNLDTDGKVTGLVLHQGGRDMEAGKIN